MPTNQCTEFTPVKGYEDRYEVSITGVVRTKERDLIARAKGGGVQKMKILQRIKVANVNKSGYKTIALVVGNKTYNTYLHRIIAEAYLPNPNPDKFKIINHKNGAKADNRIENLEWCDSGHNNRHAISTRLRRPANACIDETIGKRIRELRKLNMTYKQIGGVVKLNKGVVAGFLSGRNYKYLNI